MATKTKTSSEAQKEGKAAIPSKHAVLLRRVLVQPRLSEKASRLSKTGKYVFVVGKSANKVEVKKAIQAAYKVTVTQVNIINNQGKSRVYGRTSGKTQDFKKAVVTLKAGDSIPEATENI